MSRKGVLAGLGVLAITVLMSVGSGSVGAVAPHAVALHLAPGHSAPFAKRAHYQQLPNSYNVYTEASIGKVVLTQVLVFNGSLAWELSNFSKNTSRQIGVVAGGPYLSTNSIVAAGGAFYAGTWNSTLNLFTTYRISTLGKISHPAFGLPTNVLWTFDYGNSTSIVVSGGGGLLYELNPATLNVSANYMASAPAGLLVQNALPVGNRLYLAGSIDLNGTSSAFFGFVNQTRERSRRSRRPIS